MVKPVRPLFIQSGIVYVSLTRGHVAIINEADIDFLRDSNWMALVTPRSVYAIREHNSCGRKTTMLLHREIMSAASDVQVDHIDGNGLNNARSNLRIATRSENSRNRRLDVDSSSGLKGVYYDHARHKWIAKIRYDGRQRYIGRFNSADEAHRAYCEQSKIRHGAFGRTC